MSGWDVAAVLVDNGGVLTVPDPALVREALEPFEVPAAGVDLDRVHAVAARRYDQWALRSASAGAVTVDADRGRFVFLEAYAAAAGVDDDHLQQAASALDETFTSSGRPWSHVREGAGEALRGIAASGRPVAIVTNAAGTAEVELADLGVCQVGPGPGCEVAAVIDSGQLGYAKPDPRIFEVALAAVGVPASAAVHVGDTVYADVRGARAAGVHPVHLDPHRLCRATDHGHVRSLADIVAVIEGRRL